MPEKQRFEDRPNAFTSMGILGGMAGAALALDDWGIVIIVAVAAVIVIALDNYVR